MARFSSVALCALLAACAGVQTRLPVVDTARADSMRVALQREAIATHIARTKALQDLAWPVLRANASLCGAKIQRSLGWRLLDADIAVPFVKGLRPADIRASGFDDVARVALVIAGSPAARAGISAGDQVTAVNGTAVSDTSGVRAIGKRIVSAITSAPKGAALTLELRTAAGDVRTVQLVPDVICAYPVTLSRAGDVNAMTDGRTITINQGLLRAETSPTRLQFVIAHELAHAILRHPQKSIRNAVVSGSGVAGVLGGTFGWVADQGATILGRKPTVSYQRSGAALASYPWGRAFEREADYVGLYLLARSGADLGDVAGLFETFARESPSGTWLGLSHPQAGNRLLAAQATIDEIRAKQASSAALLPTGWPLAKPATPATRLED